MNLSPAELDDILKVYDQVADPQLRREVVGHFVMEAIIMREALNALARHKNPAVHQIAREALRLADEK